MDNSLNLYNWFNVDNNGRHGWNVQFDGNWDNGSNWGTGAEYTMTKDRPGKDGRPGSEGIEKRGLQIEDFRRRPRYGN